MKKKKVIAYSSLPSRNPAVSLTTIWLLLDKCRAPEWLMGMFYTFAVLLIVSFVVALYRDEQHDVRGFGDDSE